MKGIPTNPGKGGIHSTDKNRAGKLNEALIWEPFAGRRLASAVTCGVVAPLHVFLSLNPVNSWSYRVVLGYQLAAEGNAGSERRSQTFRFVFLTNVLGKASKKGAGSGALPDPACHVGRVAWMPTIGIDQRNNAAA